MIYQKLFKCFSNYILIHIIPNILSEEDIDVVIEEKVYNKDFQKSDCETETFDNIEELKFLQEYDGGFFYLRWFKWKRNEWFSGTSYV